MKQNHDYLVYKTLKDFTNSRAFATDLRFSPGKGFTTFRNEHRPNANSTFLGEQASRILKQDYTEIEARVLGHYLSKSEETAMNAINLLLSKNENFKFVTVIFDTDRSKTLQKHYTYKTMLDLVEDDLVVVKVNEEYKVVKVVSVRNTFEGSFQIKWIVAKLDLSHLIEVQATEEELRGLLANKEEEQRKQRNTAALEEYLGADGVTQAELIAKKVRI